MILDESPPVLSSLSISDTLEFANQNLNLTTEWILVTGKLQVGTPTAPYIRKAIITLNVRIKMKKLWV